MLRTAFGKSISVRSPVLLHTGGYEVQILCPVSEQRNIFAELTNKGYSCSISERVGGVSAHVAIMVEAHLVGMSLLEDSHEEAEKIARALSNLGYTVVFTS
jgi:hypothetical protein